MKRKVYDSLYLCSIIISGKLKGHFITDADWTHLGSKRGLVEFALNKYYPESSIEIVQQTLTSIPIIREDSIK